MRKYGSPEVPEIHERLKMENPLQASQCLIFLKKIGRSDRSGEKRVFQTCSQVSRDGLKEESDGVEAKTSEVDHVWRHQMIGNSCELCMDEFCSLYICLKRDLKFREV